jgi:hypothetical protein
MSTFGLHPPRCAVFWRNASAAAAALSLLAASLLLGGAAAGGAQNLSAIDTFNAVACASATECLGVGDALTPGTDTEVGMTAPLTAPSGSVTSGQSTQTIIGAASLQAVACLSPTECLAVGTAPSGAVAVALDPATGSVSSGQHVQPISGVATLVGVVCASATQCIGVGEGANQTTALAVPLDPATGDVSSGQHAQTISGLESFDAVACASTAQCIGVGEGASEAGGAAVALNPATGAISTGASTQLVTTDAILTGVDCPSAAECLAVGWGADDPSVAVPLDPTNAAVSTGQHEQTISSPRIVLGAVACSSTTQCVAVGNDGDDPSIAESVPLTAATGAVPAGQSLQEVPGAGSLAGIACPSSTICLAAGTAFEAQGSIVVPLTTATGATVPSGPYSPLTPIRVCDTRAGNPSGLTGPAAQCNGSPVGANDSKELHLAGAFGVPADATAVTVSVTVVNPKGPGYLTVFPGGAARPFAASLNYAQGGIVGNLVDVGTGVGGEVTLYSSAASDLVVDLEGYTAPTAAAGPGAGLFNALASPARLCDTRAGNPSNLSGGDAQCNGTSGAGAPLSSGGTRTVQVTGNNGVPAGATAVVMNVTAVGPTATGYLTVFPAGSTRPLAASVDYSSGQTTGSRVIVPLSTTGGTPGQIQIFSNQATDVVVDISGYFSAPGGTGSQYTALGTPIRICDTRAGNPSTLSGPLFQCVGKTLGPAGTLVVNAAGTAAVPTGAKDAVVNITAVNPSQRTYVSVFAGPSRPLVSDLNPAAGSVAGNLTVAPLSAAGTFSVYNNSGTVDVVIDVVGWYS